MTLRRFMATRGKPDVPLPPARPGSARRLDRIERAKRLRYAP